MNMDYLEALLLVRGSALQFLKHADSGQNTWIQILPLPFISYITNVQVIRSLYSLFSSSVNSYLIAMLLDLIQKLLRIVLRKQCLLNKHYLCLTLSLKVKLFTGICVCLLENTWQLDLEKFSSLLKLESISMNSIIYQRMILHFIKWSKLCKYIVTSFMKDLLSHFDIITHSLSYRTRHCSLCIQFLYPANTETDSLQTYIWTHTCSHNLCELLLAGQCARIERW